MGGEYIYRYGVSTATFYYPLFLFILLNSFIDNKFIYKSKANQIFIIIGYLFAIIYYAMRSFIIGVLGALIINILFKLNKPRVFRITLSIFVILFLSFLIVPVETYLEIPQLRRLVATFTEVAHKGVENNMLVRIEAIMLASTLTDNILLGAGYGDPPTYADDVRMNKARWWNHSAIAWAIYRLGFILSLMFIVTFVKIIYDIFQLSKRVTDNFIKNVLLGILFYFISLFSLAAGTNVFFRGDFLAIEIAIALGLILVIENLYLKNEI